MGTARPDAESAATPHEDGAEGARKKRFTAFHFRKRTTQERSVAGPALAVVDAEAKEEDKEEDKEDIDNVGVKATIRLSALDASGKPLSCVNEQTTYLHIVRYGASPPTGEQDTRPWVVKVVKREATVSTCSTPCFSGTDFESADTSDWGTHFPLARDLRLVELNLELKQCGATPNYLPADFATWSNVPRRALL